MKFILVDNLHLPVNHGDDFIIEEIDLLNKLTVFYLKGKKNTKHAKNHKIFEP